MKIKELFESNQTLEYSIKDSLPTVELYHGTTEEDAKGGLKNPDDFNTIWLSMANGPSRGIHLTDSLKVAQAYATTGLPRKHAKAAENAWKIVSAVIKKKYKIDPTLKRGYGMNTAVSAADYSHAYKEFAAELKKLEAEAESNRGHGGFVIKTTYTPTKVLAFTRPFDNEGGYAFTNMLREIFKKEKGKFNAIFFPASDLKPDNYKGRLPKSGYYVVFKPMQLKNQEVLEA
jgi:hypothetical protein